MKKLWLWKNFVDGRPEYWACDNPYPCKPGGGDPLTLGEPCGYAIFKESTQGRFDVSEEQVLAAIKRASVPSEIAPSLDADTIAAKDLKIQRLETALQSFVKAEGDWREQKQGMSAGTFDDPLNDAYVQAQEALAAEFIVKNGKVVRRD